MEDQYGMGDFRHYINGRPHFPGIAPPGDLFSAHRNLNQSHGHQQQQQHYEMAVMTAAELLPPEFRSDSSASGAATAGPCLNGFEMERGGGGSSGGGGSGGVGLACDSGTGRWPRQETLTLLEIRSRLDSRFKEANQKGPLWDEVSRIMSEEHGYQRSGKKCREKFENLYKYYKKTKEGKAGRQDGKHYRFFRQLEAIYGDNSNTASLSEADLVGYNFGFHNAGNNVYTQANQETLQGPKLCDSLSLCNSSEFDTSSSEDNNTSEVGLMEADSTGKKQKRRGRRGWRTKIREFIDSQMKKLIEKQEEWLEKMTKNLERKEQERMLREEEWRKQEEARIEREHKFWASERAWIEARDAAFMESLQKLTTGKLEVKSPSAEMLVGAHENGSHETITNSWNGGDSWGENEISKLIQLRTSMDFKFQECGISEGAVWEEISGKMACLGYDRRASMCQEKWESIKNYVRRANECYKKRKENPRNCCYFQNSESLYNQGEGAYGEINEQGLGANAISDVGFRFLLGNDGENLWESYGVKLSKGENL